MIDALLVIGGAFGLLVFDALLRESRERLRQSQCELARTQYQLAQSQRERDAYARTFGLLVLAMLLTQNGRGRDNQS